MADKDPGKTDPPEGTDDKAAKEAEDHFWTEHKTRTRAVLDEWFKEKSDEAAKAGPAARNGGRRTLPKIIDDILSAGTTR